MGKYNLCGPCAAGQLESRRRKEAGEADKTADDPVAVMLNWNLAGLQSSPWEFACDDECSMYMQKYVMIYSKTITRARQYFRTPFGDIVDEIFDPSAAEGMDESGDGGLPLNEACPGLDSLRSLSPCCSHWCCAGSLVFLTSPVRPS